VITVVVGATLVAAAATTHPNAAPLIAWILRELDAARHAVLIRAAIPGCDSSC
jgi:hypothetical protein